MCLLQNCRPLPAAEGCHVKLARRTERRVVSAHLAFEEWDNDTVGNKKDTCTYLALFVS